MDKVIKEFKINNSNNEDLTYQLGYNLYNNRVYPIIGIYKNEELLSAGIWTYGTYVGNFNFNADVSSSDAYGTVGSIKEMFTELRKYNNIPEEAEKEYENIFIIYKLNDFKEI
jgi:hypothetical protein